ncbi:hypothetical protein MMC25_004231 [Agyrium rufum]|nr:hypothetical protein [Agyrium rufum]
MASKRHAMLLEPCSRTSSATPQARARNLGKVEFIASTRPNVGNEINHHGEPKSHGSGVDMDKHNPREFKSDSMTRAIRPIDDEEWALRYPPFSNSWAQEKALKHARASKGPEQADKKTTRPRSLESDTSPSKAAALLAASRLRQSPDQIRSPKPQNYTSDGFSSAPTSPHRRNKSLPPLPSPCQSPRADGEQRSTAEDRVCADAQATRTGKPVEQNMGRCIQSSHTAIRRRIEPQAWIDVALAATTHTNSMSTTNERNCVRLRRWKSAEHLEDADHPIRSTIAPSMGFLTTLKRLKADNTYADRPLGLREIENSIEERLKDYPPRVPPKNIAYSSGGRSTLHLQEPMTNDVQLASSAGDSMPNLRDRLRVKEGHQVVLSKSTVFIQQA